MDEKQVIKDLPNLFKERKHVTLGMKLVCTFAITYYILYFGLMTYFVFNFNSVYDKVYFGDELNDMVMDNYYELFIARWVLQALIITSLFLVFFKKRWGKFLFMVFTIMLVAIQYQTIYPPAWLIYILEIVILLLIAPLRVVSKFTERIQIETQKINPFKDKDKK
ncbi:MAG: hypothetical protein IJT45_06535 [Bacteroidales bacterium]|nr:hypothetical protein [Bacteroidales bacterium]MCR5037143.1 hypothetical protein [Bacteroidales bacterium]